MARTGQDDRELSFTGPEPIEPVFGQPDGSHRPTGACYRALGRLPGRDSHPLVWSSFQDPPRRRAYHRAVPFSTVAGPVLREDRPCLSHSRADDDTDEARARGDKGVRVKVHLDCANWSGCRVDRRKSCNDVRIGCWRLGDVPKGSPTAACRPCADTPALEPFRNEVLPDDSQLGASGPGRPDTWTKSAWARGSFAAQHRRWHAYLRSIRAVAGQ